MKCTITYPGLFIFIDRFALVLLQLDESGAQTFVLVSLSFKKVKRVPQDFSFAGIHLLGNQRRQED